jgi:hypothetical protein
VVEGDLKHLQTATSQAPTKHSTISLPALFRAADRASLAAQRKFLWRRRTELALLVAAAVCGLIPTEGVYFGTHVVPGSILAGVLFFVAGLLETSVVTIQPERTWYQGRAVAESIKTLAWRYAVAGEPFATDAGDADSTLLQRFQQVVEQFPQLGTLPSADVDSEITTWMHSLRSAPLTERRLTYSHSRIEDQRRWYAQKAAWNRQRAYMWSVGTLVLQFVGIVAAFARGFKLEPLDLLSVVAVLSAVAVAWLQIKQHATLAESYSVAALELSAIRNIMPATSDEAKWAHFVDESETAISREHTTWRAKRA